jgi:hypothetical protein
MDGNLSATYRPSARRADAKSNDELLGIVVGLNVTPGKRPNNPPSDDRPLTKKSSGFARRTLEPAVRRFARGRSFGAFMSLDRSAPLRDARNTALC